MARSAELTDTVYEAARRRAKREDATEPRAAIGVRCGLSMLTLPLRSGALVVLPTNQIPGLRDVRDEAQLEDVVVEGGGEYLRWPGLDVDLSVPLLLADVLPIRSAASNARRAGSVKSPAKAAAVRENGKKGGRPRKPFAKA
jgi:uncharacterized protein DUF2442